MANLIASSFVSSRLDYANACLFGQEPISYTENPKHTCSCRHMLQISVQLCSSVETPPLASSLGPHSLQNCLTFKSLYTIAPSYLSSLIRPFVPSRALRSSSAQRLCAPHVSSVFGSRGFRSAGPAIWNSLPLSVTTCSTIQTFKKQLKTHLFASAFPSSWIVLNAPLIRWSTLIYLSGCPWFYACLNVCYYYYYYYK